MKNLIKFFLPVLIFAFNLHPQDKSKFDLHSPDFNSNSSSIYEYQGNGSFIENGDTGYVGTNYLPQHEGNLYQYLSSVNVLHVKTFKRDTLDPRYFFNSFSERWERYSEADKMIYVRSYDGREALFMDFNKAPGEEFLQYQPYASQLFQTALVLGGEVNLFSNIYKYKGYWVEWGSLGTRRKRTELYAENFGIHSYSIAAEHGGGNTANVIMAIIYDSTGSAHEYTFHYKPQISLMPITLIDTLVFYMYPVLITHPYNRSGIQSLNFIEKAYLENYYQKGDSIINKPNRDLTAVGLGLYKITFNLEPQLFNNGFSFNYRIVAKDKGIIPETTYSPDTGFYRCDRVTGVTDEKKLISNYYLSQNYPNPFNPLTTIEFQTPEPGIVTIKLYDILGKEIKALLNEYKESGTNELQVDASLLPSGIYFYRMITKNYTATKKMIILR